MGNTGIPPIERVPADATTVAADAADLAKDAKTVAENPEEVRAMSVANKLEVAAEKIATEKRTYDERKERRDFIRDVVQIVCIALPATIGACAAVVGAMSGITNGKVLHATHKLVNSGNLTQLKVIAVLTREKADKTLLPADIRAADEAEKAVAEHVEKQKRADDEGRDM